MKKIRALIAEDEEILSLTLIKSLERLWPELDICAVAQNGIEAVDAALKHQPDIIFLDIQMPGKTGLEVAEELADEWPDEKTFPAIVFVTAYDEYAVQAFERQAFDYLLKPINDQRLSKTLTRLQRKIEDKSEGKQGFEHLIAQLSQFKQAVDSAPGQTPVERLSMIRAAVGNQIHLVPIEDVLYFEATDKYINVATADKSYLIRVSLRELLPQLDPSNFWQVHRSYIVNTRHLQTAHKDESGKISLQLKSCKQKIQVSRVYAHLFKQM